MFSLLEVKLVFLIILANAIPILLYDLLGKRWSLPLDGGIRLRDGQRLLGDSVTLRGWVVAPLGVAAAAVIIGWPATTGFFIGLFAMLGDACSSFVKRRLKLPSGAQALGLDQIPESLLPLLVLQSTYDLSLWQIISMVMAFMVIGLLVSRLLYRFHLRKTPY